MKTRISYLLAVLTVAISCVNENVPTSILGKEEFFCHIENEETTRTTLDQNNNVIWSAEDQLVIFKKNSIPAKYQISENCVGKTSGSFYKVNSDEFNAGSELDHNVALYPYQENVEITKLDSDSPTSSYKIAGYNFPAEQAYEENSFANGAFPMAAVSDNYDLTFRNICGGIKLQLKGTQKVTSIKIEGKNSEKLAGNVDITVYADESLKPAITMASDALTTVTLNCGEGVQLSDGTSTEFVIALPPVLFSSGFTLTITDAQSKIYIIETDKANTVLRSSLLTMPAFKLDTNPSEEQPGDDELIVPVVTVSLNSTSLKLYKGSSYMLTATIKPKDATDNTVVWSSDVPSVATVDQTGLVTGISTGTATISASAGGKVAKCTVTVSSSLVATSDYIDEYGINHGKGTTIGMAIWAPVNCGYHETDFKYGKLYQWGRKYGQGYSGEFFDGDRKQTYSDATVPTIEEGGVSLVSGQHKSKSNVFFTGTSEFNYDYLYPQESKLWNSGTEANPVKTEYDPCPEGWRVPTYAELDNLNNNHSSLVTDENGQTGYWFSGENPYTETVPQVFFPSAGRRYCDGEADNRGRLGFYWSSLWEPTSKFSRNLYCQTNSVNMNSSFCAHGFSVRCVQE